MTPRVTGESAADAEVAAEEGGDSTTPRGEPGTEGAAAGRRRLGRAAAIGMVWGYGSFVISKLLIFVSTVILARLLLPDEFGVVGYALVIIGYLDIARDLGVGSALIARPQIDQRAASVAFYMSVGWGVLLTAVVFLGAPLVGDFFGDPRAVDVTRVLSLGFLFSTLGSTHDALLYRSLAFNRRVVPDVVGAIVKGVVSVALAYAGFSYWALVLGQLIGQASFCVTTWIMQPFRPRLEWDSEVARWLLGFGSAVVGVRLVAASLTNLGFLIVGVLLGAGALGIYTLAFRVPQLLLTNSFSILSTVLFPVYARLQDDPEGLRRGYVLAQRYMGLVALPLGVGLAVVSPQFVNVFFGTNWAEAGPIMQWLAVRGGVIAIGWHAGDIAKAVGRARFALGVQVASALIGLPLLVIGAALGGLVGLAAAYAVGAALQSLMSTIMLRQVVKLPMIEAAMALWPALVATAAVAGASGGLLLVTESWHDLPRLIAACIVGTLAYAVTIWFVGRDLLDRLPARFRPWQRHRTPAATTHSG